MLTENFQNIGMYECLSCCISLEQVLRNFVQLPRIRGWGGGGEGGATEFFQIERLLPHSFASLIFQPAHKSMASGSLVFYQEL
jgi:hypothetical protein